MQNTLKEVQQKKSWQGGRVSEYAYCVVADNASPMTYTGTNTWILSRPASSSVYVVDPGPDSTAHLDAVEKVCRDASLTIVAILLTHMHADHAAGSVALSKRSGAAIYAKTSRTLQPGADFAVEGGPELKVVALPGHSPDSLGFCFSSDASILTGDLIFHHAPTLIGSAQGSLSEYFTSLESVRHLVLLEGFRRLLPAHGCPLEQPLRAIQKAEAHRLDRLARIRSAIIRNRSADIEKILDEVYSDVEQSLLDAAFESVEAQLAYLRETDDSCLKV